MSSLPASLFFFFFFNDTPTTEIYPLPLHDALPILPWRVVPLLPFITAGGAATALLAAVVARARTEQRTDPLGERRRSEEHTSELQSPCNLVCRLLLEKTKTKQCTRSALALSVTPIS